MSSYPPYPEYKDSGVDWLAEVPAHWEVSEVRYVSEVRASNVDKKSVDSESEVRLCNYTDVYYNDFITDQINFMPATATDAQIEKFTLEQGDVLLTKDSEASDDIANAAYVAADMPGVLCGYHLAHLRPAGSTSGLYLKWFFDSTFAQSMAGIRSNGLTRVGLKMSSLGSIPIPLPNSSEQRAIAEFLRTETSRIDRLVVEQHHLIALLEEKRQAVISHAVTTGLNPDAPMKSSGVEWLGEVPAHWEVSPVRLVARLESGHTPSRSRPEYWQDCTVPWFSLSDIWQVRKEGRMYISETKEQVSEIGLANSAARKLPAGTVMLSRTASVGFPAIMKREMATTQDFANWVCGEQILPEYLYFCFRAMSQEFERLRYGSTHNTIYMPDIRKLRVGLPPIDEQVKIVDYILQSDAKLRELIQEAEGAIELLKLRRSSLISEAVTGKIDVRDHSSDMAVA